MRTQTQWELCQPTTADRPAQRTGHICVTYGDRIIVYVSPRTLTAIIYHVTLASEAPTVNTITMTHGRMMSTHANGQNFNVLASFLPRVRDTRQLWWTMSSTSLEGGASMARIWETWPHSNSPVSIYIAHVMLAMRRPSATVALLLYWTVTDHARYTDQRWYMFQNMGPAPSARSGHAMSSMGSRVFVLGGESFTPTRGDDHGIIHVLDTSLSIITSYSFHMTH